SKVALVHLIARLRAGGFRLLDTQFVTGHLAQFGAREIPREDYRLQLAAALDAPAQWIAEPDAAALAEEIRVLASRQGVRV
ncbi:MAG: leucyl/phenylalanyl-tRNA--protein transferase, partial [Acetobacteraceae bacterium]